MNGIGYKNYFNYPHFKQRAQWIQDNLSGSILEVGCAAGYLILEARKLGVTISGIDKSKYIVEQSSSEIASQIILDDIVNIDPEKVHFDWIVSWNVLDCLNDDIYAKKVADILNSISVNQLHVLCMSEQRNKYTGLGYFIRDVMFWRGLFPDVVLVCSECRKVYNPTMFGFSQIPLHVGKGVSD